MSNVADNRWALTMRDSDEKAIWFYESYGERRDAVSEQHIAELISAGDIAHGTAVWKKGFPDWMSVENT